jgi:uncharacterized protein YcaQ
MRDGGSLLPRDVGAREAIDWYWRPTNQVRAILEGLAEVGTIGIARREGNLRVYDLSERLFPPAILAERRDEEEQQRHRLLARYRGNGLLGASGNQELWVGGMGYAAERAARRSTLVDEGRLVPVQVEGLKGERFIVGEDLPFVDQAERELAARTPPGGVEPAVTFLAPLDPLCWDRDLLRRLFGFDYVWEVYVPEPKRRWGYYVLPLLYGDQLVGRIEPRLERRAGTLRVAGIWWEPGFDPLAVDGFVAALARALLVHRDFGDLDRIELPTATRHRRLGTSLRGAIRVLDERAGEGRARAGKRPRRAAVGTSGSHKKQPPSRRRNRQQEAPDG